MSEANWTIAAVTGITAAYALGSRRLSDSPVSSAIVFAGFGILLGPVGLDLVSPQHGNGPLLAILEAALTLVLFTDAMEVPLKDLRTGSALPSRLLGIGLVLSIAAGSLLAWPLLPGLTMWELALVGAILAPTDAALSSSAISNPGVPHLVRQTLNVEGGLNDGMALPFFVLFLAAVPGTSYAEGGIAGTLWRTLLLSAALGLAVGWLGSQLLRWSYRRRWITREWSQIYLPALAAGAYALAAATKGSGFIAAWVAGLALADALRKEAPASPQDAHATESNNSAKSTEPAKSLERHERPESTESLELPQRPEQPERPELAVLTELTEYLGSLLTMLSLLIFGAVLLGPALEHLSWRIVAYALLSLTAVRMIPVALALAGSGLRRPTVAYIAWFGPRGLPSIVLGLLAAEEHIAGAQFIGQVVAVTVGFSILLHGMSAVTLSDRYAQWYKRAATAPGLRESEPSSSAVQARTIGAPDPRST